MFVSHETKECEVKCVTRKMVKEMEKITKEKHSDFQ